MTNIVCTLDSRLTKNAHASNIARICYFVLRRLSSIRGLLTSTATAILQSAFVLSRIDYWNSLLQGSIDDLTSHLLRIKNYAARVIVRLQKSSNITTYLWSLHSFIHSATVLGTYKYICLYYHCHRSTAPSYVADMLLLTCIIHFLMTYNHNFLILLQNSVMSKDDKSWTTANMLNHNGNKIELMSIISIGANHLHSLPTLFIIRNAHILFKICLNNIDFTVDSSHLSCQSSIMSAILLRNAILKYVVNLLFIDSWQLQQLAQFFCWFSKHPLLWLTALLSTHNVTTYLQVVPLQSDGCYRSAL